MEEKRIEDSKLGKRHCKARLCESEMISPMVIFHNRNLRHITELNKDIFGKLYGDKGYISKAMANILWGNGIQMIIKLKKSVIIASVNVELKNIGKLQHTRHRSVSSFSLNILGAIAAYASFPKNPSLNIQFETKNKKLLLGT